MIMPLKTWSSLRFHRWQTFILCASLCLSLSPCDYNKHALCFNKVSNTIFDISELCWKVPNNTWVVAFYLQLKIEYNIPAASRHNFPIHNLLKYRIQLFDLCMLWNFKLTVILLPPSTIPIFLTSFCCSDSLSSQDLFMFSISSWFFLIISSISRLKLAISRDKDKRWKWSFTWANKLATTIIIQHLKDTTFAIVI